MGAHFSIQAGAVGGGAANASYITRTQAADEGDELYHNAPDSVENADTWDETKIRFRSWAERVEAEEKAKHGNRTGQPRTHYRAVISYEDEIPTEAVKEDVSEFLEEEFPEAQAVAVVHQDTDHSHAHVWMSARKTDGKKVHIGNGDLKGMHATMDEIYEERMGVQSRNAEKVEETREFKRALAQVKEEGVTTAKLWAWTEAHRPERASPPGREVFQKREKRLAGEGVVGDAEAQLESYQAEQMEKSEELISEAKDRIGRYERQQTGATEAERGANQSAEKGQRRERESSQDEGRSDQHISGGESQSSRRPGRQAREQAKEGAGCSGDDHGGDSDRGHVDNSDRSGRGAVAGSSGDSPPEVGSDRRSVGGSATSASGNDGAGVEGNSEQLEDQGEWDLEEHLQAEHGVSSDQAILLRRVLREDVEDREGGLLDGLDLWREEVKEVHDFLAERADEPFEKRVSKEWAESDHLRLRLDAVEGRIKPALEAEDSLQAARAFLELEDDRRTEVWGTLSSLEQDRVYGGAAEVRRRKAGVQDAYERLSERERAIAEEVQVRVMRDESASERISEDLESLSEDAQDAIERAKRIYEALPTEDGKELFQKAAKKAKASFENENEKGKGQGKGQSRSRRYGGQSM